MNSILFPIVFSIILLLSAGTIQAAPSISGVSGTVSNGQTVTVSGSGFGTKSQAAPLISSYDNSNSQNNWVSGSLAGGWYAPHAAISLSGSAPLRSSAYQSSTKLSYPNSYSDAYHDLGYTHNAADDKVYVSFWQYRDGSSWNMLTGSGNNNKLFRIYGDSTGGGSPVVTIQDPDADGVPEELAFGGGDGMANCPGYSIAYTACGGYKYVSLLFDVRSSSCLPTLRGWYHYEIYFDYPSSVGGTDGSATLWLNGKTVFRVSGVSLNSAGQANDARLFRLGQVSGGASPSYDEYLDQVYIDNTPAHVFISSSSTLTWPDYGSDHHSEIQVPSAWSSGSITFTVNQGSFASGSTAYLYVVDSTGAINTNGYAITFGGSSGTCTQAGGTCMASSCDAYQSCSSLSGTCSSGYCCSGSCTPADTTPPGRSGGSPSGTLQAGTTSATLSLATSEPATCRYSTSPGVAYPSMANTFSTTGGTTHSTQVTGLQNGTAYNYYVRCNDTAGNYNTDDYQISFSVASPSQTCGNNAREGTEACDGTDLAGQTCISRGFSGGTLTCFANCSGFNTAACTLASTCSDGIQNQGEMGVDCGGPCPACAVNIIIDNADTGFTTTGTWQPSGYAGYYGTNSVFADVNQGSTGTWTPTITQSGIYSVYAWWTAGAGRINDAKYTVNHVSGQIAVIADQKLNGGQWNLLGNFTLNAGTSGYVRINDSSTDSNYVADSVSDSVCADAVMFVYAGTAYNKADTNQDGCISMNELQAFIARWQISSQDVTLKELIEAIGLWKSSGC